MKITCKNKRKKYIHGYHKVCISVENQKYMFVKLVILNFFFFLSPLILLGEFLVNFSGSFLPVNFDLQRKNSRAIIKSRPEAAKKCQVSLDRTSMEVEVTAAEDDGGTETAASDPMEAAVAAAAAVQAHDNEPMDVEAASVRAIPYGECGRFRCPFM